MFAPLGSEIRDVLVALFVLTVNRLYDQLQVCELAAHCSNITACVGQFLLDACDALLCDFCSANAVTTSATLRPDRADLTDSILTGPTVFSIDAAFAAFAFISILRRRRIFAVAGRCVSNDAVEHIAETEHDTVAGGKPDAARVLCEPNIAERSLLLNQRLSNRVVYFAALALRFSHFVPSLLPRVLLRRQ
jgi:hypothetical protein